MDNSEKKKELRKTFQDLRSQLDEEYWRECSGKIMARWLTGFPNTRSLHMIHLFLGIKERREVNTDEFLEEFNTNHPWMGIVIPYIDKIAGVMKHVQLASDIRIEKNRWGIPEPVAPRRFIHPKEIDMVIVPLLAFDLAGSRLGYGGGYYDRFLKMLRPGVPKIGIGFEISRSFDLLPVEAWDVKLDGVVTEERIYYYDSKLIRK